MSRPEYAPLVYPWMMSGVIALAGAGVVVLNHFVLGAVALSLIAFSCVRKGANIVLDKEGY